MRGEANLRSNKSAAAFRTTGEAAQELEVPAHVLRFWESKFPQLKPLKRGGGRRYYRPEDIDLLRRIRQCLYHEGYTIRGVQKLLREGPLRESPGRESPGRESPGRESPGRDRAVPTARSGVVLAVSADGTPEPSPATLRAALDEVRQELSRIRNLLAALLAS